MERTASSSASSQRNLKRQGSASTRRIQEPSGGGLNVTPMYRQGRQSAPAGALRQPSPDSRSRQTARRAPGTSAALRKARLHRRRRRLLLSLAFRGLILLTAGGLALAAYIHGRAAREPENPAGTLSSTGGAPGIGGAESDQPFGDGDASPNTDAPDTKTPQPDASALPSDTEAPVILADDIFVTAGSTVSYKKAIRFYDNLDSVDELTLDVDNHGVDLNTVGDYPYTATVTDRNGNAATAGAVVHVLAAGSEVADIDEVNALADQILADITNDSMTPKERLRAIYDWIQDTMHYEGDSQEEDVVLAAYTGFTEHTGNCFTYMAQAKFLLTQAGIDNLVITKVVPEGRTDISTHYWNIVNIGEGWYHYDCTPRRNRRDFFYITDAELKEYSDQHAVYGTHVYDPSLYPKME